MQLEGTKAWNLYAPKYQLALKKQIRGKAGDVVRRDEMGDLLMQVRDPSALVSRLWSELVNGKFGANLRRRWLTAHCVTARNVATNPTPDFFCAILSLHLRRLCCVRVMSCLCLVASSTPHQLKMARLRVCI